MIFIKHFQRRSFASSTITSFQTHFGPLVNIRPHPLLKKNPAESIEILQNESTSKLMRIIEKQNGCYMFDNTANYEQTVRYHNALKQRFVQKFTGTKNHPRDLYASSRSKSHRFHLFRMMQSVINKGMSRLGYHMFKDGSLDLAGKIPDCSGVMPELIQDWKAEFNAALGDSFNQPDYFISIPLYHEVLFANELEKGVDYILTTDEGFPIKGSYGVTMPFPEHIELFDTFLCGALNATEEKTVLDIGTNTAVLSTILGFRGASKIVKYDQNKYAIKALKMNAESLKLNKYRQDRIIGITSAIVPESESEKYDLIISMPPLLHCSHLESDAEFANIHFDPDANMLKSCFKTARMSFNYVSRIMKQHKIERKLKEGGHFLLLFGNVGEILEINEADIVQQQCQAHDFKIVNELKKPYSKYEFYPHEHAGDIKDAQLSLFDIQKM